MNAFTKLAILQFTRKPQAERLAVVRAFFSDPDAGTLVKAVAESLPPVAKSAFLSFVKSLEYA